MADKDVVSLTSGSYQQNFPRQFFKNGWWQKLRLTPTTVVGQTPLIGEDYQMK
jgi:hypothetical protein